MTTQEDWLRQRVRELEHYLIPATEKDMKQYKVESDEYVHKFDRYVKYRLELRKKKIEISRLNG